MPDAIRAIAAAEDAEGGPVTTARLLAVLRKIGPKQIPPLTKRGYLQGSLLQPIGDGRWELTPAGRARV